MLVAVATVMAMPAMGQTPAKKFTSADLLKWQAHDQQLWTAGAVEGIANTLILSKRDAGTCVLKWYGDGTAKFAVFKESAQRYPNEEPIAILIGLANRACKFLD
jgi:hypothetical protein